MQFSLLLRYNGTMGNPKVLLVTPPFDFSEMNTTGGRNTKQAGYYLLYPPIGLCSIAASLEQAGFDYDSTCGYNESIGFKNGTSQPFRPQGATRLLELPMVIQDTSLFYPRTMRLKETQAWDICKITLDNVIKVGGVITLSWHTRSLSPERLWGEFYKKLLGELKNKKAWFGTAIQVVDWFRQRRSVIFGACQVQKNQINIQFKCGSTISGPRMCLRIHHGQKVGQKKSSSHSSFIDLPFMGEPQIQIPLSTLEEI